MELICGWTMSFVFLFIITGGTILMTDMNYKYSTLNAAIYTAFAPIAWCFIFAWIVYITHHGYNSE